MRASNSSSVASPQASETPSDAASCSAAAMPHGPSSVLDSHAWSPASRAARSASRAGRKPPAGASFTFTASQAPELGGAPHVVGRADRLVGRDRDADARRGPRPAPRASRTAAPRAGGRTPRARRSARPPRPPSRRRWRRRAAPARGRWPRARRRTRSSSSGRPTLTLKQEKPAPDRGDGRLGHLLRRAGGQRAVHGDRVGAGLAERALAPAGLEVELGQLPGRARLGRRAAWRRPVAQRLPDVVERHAVVGLERRRLAEARRRRPRPRAGSPPARAPPPRRRRSRTARAAGSTGAAASASRQQQPRGEQQREHGEQPARVGERGVQRRAVGALADLLPGRRREARGERR